MYKVVLVFNGFSIPFILFVCFHAARRARVADSIL
jgi:hypothetical protein